jgi:hypothetical protein
MGVADFVIFEECSETQPIRQLSHLDGIFYDSSLVFQREPMIIGFVDLDHFLVDIPAKSLIQASFLFTKMAPVFQVAKIEETEIYRFFELIHPGAGQKNSGNMGVSAFEVRNRMRIKGGIGQCLTQGLKELQCLHVASFRMLLLEKDSPSLIVVKREFQTDVSLAGDLVTIREG